MSLTSRDKWECRGIGGADPQVRAGPPGPSLRSQNRLLAAGVWPARGPVADRGVRPTIYARARQTGKVSGIGLKPAPPSTLPDDKLAAGGACGIPKANPA